MIWILRAQNNKTRFFFVLYADKTWVFDQSERAQGPIYVINTDKGYYLAQKLNGPHVQSVRALILHQSLLEHTASIQHHRLFNNSIMSSKFLSRDVWPESTTTHRNRERIIELFLHKSTSLLNSLHRHFQTAKKRPSFC